MAKAKKLDTYPDWLYNDNAEHFTCSPRYVNYFGWDKSCDPRIYPNRRPEQHCEGHPVCLWLCSGCGAPQFFRQPEGKHGGPQLRDALDPRYGYFRGPCWRSRVYGIKCVTPKGLRVLYHKGAPWPNWEVWDRLESYGRTIAAKERAERAKAKREGYLQ